MWQTVNVRCVLSAAFEDEAEVSVPRPSRTDTATEPGERSATIEAR